MLLDFDHGTKIEDFKVKVMALDPDTRRSNSNMISEIPSPNPFPMFRDNVER